ncbi:MAG: hypothetical protein KGL39_16955 [Patescibacteria group bacterium]|nr:hypothetical protein [Patescibacteria group bacterium]
MTNTVWQQRSPVHRYLAEGEDGNPQYVPPVDDSEADAPWTQDQFEQQIAEANGPSYLQVSPDMQYLSGANLAAPIDAGPVAPPDTGQTAPLGSSSIPGMPGVTFDMLEAPLPVSSSAPDKTPNVAPVPWYRDLGAKLGLTNDSGRSNPVPTSGGYGDIMNRYQAELANMPTRGNPSWLQRLAAAGFGAVAGYTNAAGRIRTPIDIAKGQENILYPGYDNKMAAWQSRVAPLQQSAQIAGERQAAQWKGQQIQAESALKQAQAIAAMQHGQYWLNRSQQERNQWKIDPKTGALYNTVNGTRVDRPITPQDRFETALALIPATDPDRTEKASYYALNGKIPDRPEHNANEWQMYLDAYGGDSRRALAAREAAQIRVAQEKAKTPDPLVDIARQAQIDKLKNDELDKIADTKNRSEQQIQARRTAEINNLFSANRMGEQARDTAEGQKALRAINRKYAPMLQNVQNEFANQARRRGVAAEDFDVNPDTLEYSPRVQQSTGGNPVAVNLPNGKTKLFPNAQAAAGFARAAGIPFLPQ